jgi:small neutral amino acid transporter SnatA (MarC family)
MTAHSRAWRAAIVLVGLLVVSFGVVAPPERCPSVSAADIKRSAQAAVNWFVRNQQPDGTWLYVYDARSDTAPHEYDEVRHAGAVQGLYQAAAAGLPGALDAADLGTRHALDALAERDGWAAVTTGGEIATGATALLVAGLDIRRKATGDARYDGVMRRLGRFLVAQVEPSGAVHESFDAVRAAPVPGTHSKYYTGETYWALARLHRTFPGEGWGAVADRIGAYLATRRDKAEGHWPPIPDHWAAYGLAETATFRPLTGSEVRYARRQAELWGGQARWVQQRFGPWGAVVRGRAVFRGGWYGVMDEGFTGLWRIAREDPRLADLQGPIARRASCVAGIAVREQADAVDAARYARPSRVQGAWFFHGGETRMDDQQHALAALLRAVPIVQAGVPASDEDAPSVVLWAVALLLALNPPRAAFGIPRAGRSPREAAQLAALGGAIGVLVVCAAAAAGVAWLDVSAPAAATAAGLVALLAGAADLFRSPPSPEPALAGRRAVVVPVAIPLVARPALLVMALAQHDVLATACVMALGVAAMAALAVRSPTEGAGDRVLQWAARLLAAGLVAAGVLLAIDGILAV